VKAIAARRHHRQAPVVLLVLALLVMGGVYAAFATTSADATVVTQSDDDVEAGRKLFAANCASCHGLNAEGRQNAPSLVGVGAASVYFQVSTGRMPMQADAPQAEAKPPQFGEEATRQLAAYVASLGAGPAIPTEDQVDPAKGDPASGMALFRTNCSMCHAASGAGGALTQGKYAPSVLNTDPAAIYTAMATGPQSMPVFNDMTLTPEEKRDIIAFIDAQKEGAPGGLDLGQIGPVGEGMWAFIVGMGLLIACAVWIGAKSS
jgi:ubiquinol-cytochrome c reductase cytochrome c subunit